MGRAVLFARSKAFERAAVERDAADMANGARPVATFNPARDPHRAVTLDVATAPNTAIECLSVTTAH